MGLVGLMTAIKRYDVNHSSGASFNTYAYYWIRAEIGRFENQHLEMIRYPNYKKKENDLKYISIDQIEEYQTNKILMKHDLLH